MSVPGWLRQLPSIAYPAPKQGYWLPVTSTINWCEEDYYATKYSAEIVNSLTNLTFFFLACKGLYSCYKNKHEAVFFVNFIGYGITGLGSFAFHSSLKYPMQLVDELAMIYTTSFSCFASFSYRRSTTFSVFLAIFLIGLCAFITGYYHYLQDPEFHQRSYAILTATVLLRNMWVMDKRLRPSRKPDAHLVSKMSPADKAERMRQDRRDAKILSTMWLMIAWGLGVFLGGFGVWNLDNKYCGLIRQWRKEIGLPWGVLLEGHGWWHIMTGTGAYFYITWGIWLRHCLNGEQDEYELRWPSILFSLPEVRRRTPAEIQTEKKKAR